MKRSEQQRTAALELQDCGVPIEEITRLLGVPREVLSRWLRGTGRVRTCQLCGVEFVAGNGRQRFCCRAHQLAYRRGAPAMRVCRYCGAEFEPRHGHQRFGRPEHQREHQRRAASPTSLGSWRQRVRELQAELEAVRAELDQAADVA